MRQGTSTPRKATRGLGGMSFNRTGASVRRTVLIKTIPTLCGRMTTQGGMQ